MTLGWPIPATNDAAQQRLELELLLKQPVPDPDQLERSLPLLNALNEISPDRWRELQALEKALADLVNRGDVSQTEAMAKASKPIELERLLA